jgi:Raf kinase inhibitor-like YbhB/YbcL family protein
MRAAFGLVAAGVLIVAGCRGGREGESKAVEPGGVAMSIRVSSSAFSDGQPIPRKYTGEDADISPRLSWSNVPASAKELALICDDPDAPQAEPWVHWVL